MSIPNTMDVQVVIDVSHPQATVGLSNPAFFVPSTTEGYKEYSSLDAIAADYYELNPIYQEAQAVFSQDNAPQLVAVIKYLQEDVEDTTARLTAPANVKVTASADGATITADTPAKTMIPGIVQAAKDYWYQNWEFALMPTFNAEDAQALAGLLDKEDYHIFLPQMTTEDEGKAFAEFERTWPVVESNTNYHIAASLVGAGGSQTVGSLNWKFLNSLEGIGEPTYKNAREEARFEAEGLLCYTVKNGIPALSEDRNAKGYFIDQKHGKDWIKSNVESNLQGLFFANKKVPYSSDGIALIDNNIRTTLAQAWNQGIIATIEATGAGDYDVKVKPISEIAVSDILKRAYNGASFSYRESNAINSARVHGELIALV